MVLALALGLGVLRPGEAQAAPGASEPKSGDGGFDLVAFALPGYQPETGWLVGGAAVLVHQPPKSSGRKESSLMLAGAATLRSQATLVLQPEWYFLDDRLQLSALAGVEYFPDKFYGIGKDTREENEETYTPRYLEMMANPCWRVADSLYVGPIFRLQSAEITGVKPDGLLARGSIPGSAGGTAVQAGLTATWDARDSALYPRHGAWAKLTLMTARPELGSTFDYSVGKLDVRGYFTLPWLQHILALQALLELRTGEVPFYDQGRLGGPTAMRGYFSGQYRDRQMGVIQAEYRAPLFWRFGMVAFASVGDVADQPAGLLDEPKVAGGLGLRFAPLADVPVNVRLDIAYGSGLFFYLRMSEAF